MPAIELNPHDVDADESSDPHKRRVALLVAAITLLGSVVGYLHTKESNLESGAARLAEEAVIAGFGAQLSGTAQARGAYSAYIESKLIERQTTLIRSQARLATDPGRGAAQRLEADRWAAVRMTLNDLSPLLGGEFDERTDPRFPERYFARTDAPANAHQLSQLARRELVEDHRTKAGDYLVVLTTLAVSLFLIGLSLTVAGAGRRFLVLTGIGLAVASAFWTWRVDARHVRTTPQDAVEAVAEGDRLRREGNFDDAIASYSRAIEKRPDYAVAYARRASTWFVAGTPQDAFGLVSITDPENLRKAVEDRERAVRLPGGATLDTLTGLGFDYFLQARYHDSVRLSERAIRLNDRLAVPWFNLGVAQLARGNEGAAARAYERAISLSLEENDEILRGELMASARTDLELLVRQDPQREPAALRMAGRLTAFEAAKNTGKEIQEVRPDARVSRLDISNAGLFLRADYRYQHVAPGTTIAFVWYQRSAADQPWSQTPSMNRFDELEGKDATGDEYRFFSFGACLRPGDYRLDLYAGDRRLATKIYNVRSGRLGSLVETRDELAGVTFCHPGTWKPLTLGSGDMTGYVAPDGTGGIAVGSVVAPAGGRGVDKVAVMDEAVRFLGEGLGGSSLDPVRSVRLGEENARMITSNAGGFPASIAAYLGDDRIVRIVVFIGATPAGRDTVFAELSPTISFS